jgi:serine/threonine protein kinase
MDQIHPRDIRHADLKPESVFLDEKYEPLISTQRFSRSKFHSDSADFADELESPIFVAPELHMSEFAFTNKIDIFSDGSLIYPLFREKFQSPRGVPRGPF